jgi:hypothetical protein
MNATADFVKPRTYQNLEVGGFDQLEDDSIDEYKLESHKEKNGH